jgi:hypothetical protein
MRVQAVYEWFCQLRGSEIARTGRPQRLLRRRMQLEPLEPRVLLANDVVISELLASNSLGLLDFDGDSSDWLEIHNRDVTNIDLNGWHLTDRSDNLTKWPFPLSTVLAPDERLVVFASNKDFVAPNGELHTNFAMSSGGEFLGLADPLGLLVHGYSPAFPPQSTDVSYGLDESTPTIDDATFFATPTPGEPNSIAFGGLLPPTFSITSQTFPVEVTLELMAGDSEEMIRFTTDGLIPDETSAVYTEALTITSSTQIRARVFRDGFVPSNTVSETYIKLAEDIQTISSDLPIVVIENFEGVTPADKVFRNAFMSVFEPDVTGRSRVTGAADLNSRIGMHRRGGSTFGNPKLNLRIETRDELDQDQSVELLGFPSESDFILYAPYSFDRAMIRNTTMFELSNQIGRYATRTRFVELYANFNDGELETSDYLGVYVLEENIKADDNRVDIPRLSPNQNSEPDITGGYIFKVDRSDGTNDEFMTPRNTYVIVEPNPDDITPEQRTYLAGYVSELEDALFSTDFTDPLLGYKAFLNVDPTIDHHILRYLSNIVDHFQLSTHLVKHRNGKAEYGPIWDHDRSMGSDGGGDSLDPAGFGVFLSTHWFNRLFQDPDFAHAWVDRWTELRQTFFSVENIHAIVDGQAAEIAEAQVRNFERWPAVAPNGGAFAEPGLTGWEGEVSHVKEWLRQRLEWTDSQLVGPVSFNLDVPNLPSAFELTLSAPAGTIYYTLDGTDPLATGGQTSPQAILYEGQPIIIGAATSITARALDPNTQLPWTWSAMTSAQYSGGLTDFDDNGTWDLGDLNLVLFNWNADGTNLDPQEWVNNRPSAGTAVGLAELNQVLFNWGQPSLVAAVPALDASADNSASRVTEAETEPRSTPRAPLEARSPVLNRAAAQPPPSAAKSLAAVSSSVVLGSSAVPDPPTGSVDEVGSPTGGSTSPRDSGTSHKPLQGDTHGRTAVEIENLGGEGSRWTRATELTDTMPTSSSSSEADEDPLNTV